MRTPITYYGGKQRLCSTIINMMPKHDIYVEPFFGGGSVFWAKEPSKVEVINDIESRVIVFYKQVVNNFEELHNRISNTLHSEAEWLRARRIYYRNGEHSAANVFDVDKAWAFWVLTNMGYSGSPNCGWKWDNAGSTPTLINNKRKEFTAALKNRLATVQISCRDAITVIEQRDTPKTFFYLDPPYINCCQQHYSGYSSNDFSILITTLGMLKGKFILSNFWSDELEKAIKTYKWKYKIVESNLTVAGNCRVNNRKKQEILVYNYEIETELFT